MPAETRETTWRPPRTSGIAGLAVDSWQTPVASKAAAQTAIMSGHFFRYRFKDAVSGDVRRIQAFEPQRPKRSKPNKSGSS